MKRFFVIGNKASKSLSPLIFNHWFNKYKIQAKYTYVEVNKANFKSVMLKTIYEKKTLGFNVTIPFKKEALKYLDEKDRHVENIGAVNCVTLGRKVKGKNTDWLGYLNSIKTLNIKKNKNIIILGYGGAAQAIVYAFSSKGFKNVVVFNRTKKIISFSETRKFTKKYKLIDSYLTKADLIINTTPTNPLSRNQIKLVEKGVVVSDIVYKPMNTKFLKNFKENKKIYGLSMLVEQAIPCFRLWFGFEPRVDTSLIKKLKTKAG